MGRTVILSEETVSSLLEAHASLAAWYYELVRALQSQTPPSMPDEATRLAFLARLAQDFPEIAAVAKGITAPRTYVPPPPAFTVPPGIPARPPEPVISAAGPFPAASAPASAPAAEASPPAPAEPAVPQPTPARASVPEVAVPPPPPLVLPGTVKYE